MPDLGKITLIWLIPCPYLCDRTGDNAVGDRQPTGGPPVPCLVGADIALVMHCQHPRHCDGCQPSVAERLHVTPEALVTLPHGCVYRDIELKPARNESITAGKVCTRNCTGIALQLCCLRSLVGQP